MSESDKHIAENLRRLMERAGQTCATKLSIDSGLNITFVGDVLRGKVASPKFSSIEKISNTLGCDIAEFASNPVKNYSNVDTNLLSFAVAKAFELKGVIVKEGVEVSDSQFSFLAAVVYEKMRRGSSVSTAEILPFLTMRQP